jgi:hypothetical protein
MPASSSALTAANYRRNVKCKENSRDQSITAQRGASKQHITLTIGHLHELQWRLALSEGLSQVDHLAAHDSHLALERDAGEALV